MSILFGLGFMYLSAVPAWADCDIVPNGTTILAPETRPAGTVIHNSDYDVLQVCLENGDWQAVGPIPEDPCLTGPVGTACRDGAVFAGLTVGDARMYVADADETANGGTYAYGGYGTDLNGDNSSVVPELLNDGLANTNWLLASGAGNHHAAQACRDKGPDWYLPAIDELGDIYDRRAQLGAANLPTSTSFYWSSSEYSNNFGRFQRFSDGMQINFSKNVAHLVRCVRR